MSFENAARRGHPGRKLAIAATIGVAVALGGGIAIANASNSPQPQDYGIRALTATASDGDQLPQMMLDGQPRLDPKSTRALGERDGARYWVGLNPEGKVCLIALVGSEKWAAGMSCTDAAGFKSAGTGLRLYGPDGLVEAYLTPDNAPVNAPVEKLSGNLYVGDPNASVEQRAAAASRSAKADPGAFSLHVFDEPFSLDKPTDEVPK